MPSPAQLVVPFPERVSALSVERLRAYAEKRKMLADIREDLDRLDDKLAEEREAILSALLAGAEIQGVRYDTPRLQKRE